MLLSFVRALPLLCTLSLLFVPPSFALDKDSVEDVILKSYNLDPEAPEIVDRLLAKNPDHPLIYLIKMSQLYWLNVYTKYDSELKDDFESVAKKAYKVGKSYESEHEDDPDAAFYLGMIELGMARYYIDEGKWFQSFLKVRPGLKRMRKILEEDPEYHDAKQSLGLAHCYLAEAPGYLKGLTRLISFKGDFDYGWQLLQESKENGDLTKYESAIYLADVADELLDDPIQAREMMETLVNRFPNNIYFQRELAVYEQRTNLNEQAIARFERMCEIPGFENYYRVHFDVLIRLGQYYMSQKKSDEALECAEACLAQMDTLDHEGTEHKKGWALLLKAAVLDQKGKPEAAILVYSGINKKPNTRAYEIAQSRISDLEEIERN